MAGHAPPTPMHKPRNSYPDSLREYLNAIGRYPLLNATQEIELSRLVQRFLELQQITDRPLTQQEKREYRMGERAREKLIKCNLRLVVNVAKKNLIRIKTGNLDLMDLIQEGTIGLHRAAELFDGTRGYKFSTYSYWWIRQAITRAIDTYDRIVRVPTNALEKLTKAQKAKHQFMQSHGRAPSIDELAELINTNPETLMMIAERSTPHASLNALAITDGTPLIEMISDDQEADDDLFTPDELRERSAALRDAVDSLEDDARYIIITNYGLDGQEPVTLTKMSANHGVSREAIRQRKVKALAKLTRKLSTISRA